MKPSKLNTIRWIILILPYFFLTVGLIIDQKGGVLDKLFVMYTLVSTVFIIWILTLIFFIFKRNTISNGLKKTLGAMIPVLSLTYFVLVYGFRGFLFFDIYLNPIISIALISSVVLSIICYLDKVEIILAGLIMIILIGFILNRLGIDEGGFIIPSAFFLSSAGFILLIFKTIKEYKGNKMIRRIFVSFFGVIAVLDGLFLIKFLAYRPAFSNTYDTIGVIIFLLACLALLIILPFSNFTEWPKPPKTTFKMLIVLPFLFFLFIFSLKFLLPENTYRKLFYKEYGKKGVVHFYMKDYEVNFDKKK